MKAPPTNTETIVFQLAIPVTNKITAPIKIANTEVSPIEPGFKPAAQIKSHAVRQVIESPVEEHSKKPEETRRRIMELLGDVPRIELFARQRSPGWDAWGNEIGEQDEK